MNREKPRGEFLREVKVAVNVTSEWTEASSWGKVTQTLGSVNISDPPYPLKDSYEDGGIL